MAVLLSDCATRTSDSARSFCACVAGSFTFGRPSQVSFSARYCFTNAGTIARSMKSFSSGVSGDCFAGRGRIGTSLGEEAIRLIQVRFPALSANLHPLTPYNKGGGVQKFAPGALHLIHYKRVTGNPKLFHELFHAEPFHTSSCLIRLIRQGEFEALFSASPRSLLELNFAGFEPLIDLSTRNLVGAA